MIVQHRTWPAVTVAAIALLSTAGCWDSGPARIVPPALDPQSGQRALTQFDANHDGVLDGAELDKAPGLKAALKQVDTHGDGRITAEEINARIHSWELGGIGLMTVNCTVLHNGNALPGATVAFIPESFLGDHWKAASGITDLTGMALIAVGGGGKGNPSGIPPGFYRIEVTKSGESIPAKYNSETVLGQEVAVDARGFHDDGIIFDLKY